jgi:hypothetical protein
MPTNFFTNQRENSLYKKFVGVFEHMQNIEVFKSVIGYFRASGYFAICKHFPAIRSETCALEDILVNEFFISLVSSVYAKLINKI